MSVTKDTVRKIAHLARIYEPEDRLEPLARELSTILEWVEQLEQVETTNVPPMTSAVDVKLPLREDVVTDGGYAEDIIANAPGARDHFFTVPKVLE